ncbi:GIY-YIG nuclease family protein [Aminobacter sp. Piv2-1]|uniref:GIY-YIG nuclease family protein n=1 Tax=Aminobacter sp. Piv2-1 TaxID=3031122 RepID=UPI00403FBBFC
MGEPQLKVGDWREAVKSVRRDRVERLLAREISWSPDGSIELVLAREFVVPDDPGVYLIHDLRGVLYVGQSRHLRQRFVQHDRLRRNRLLRLAISRPVGIMKFSWRLVADEEERAVFERELIAILQPVCNRQLLDTPLI